MISPKTVSEQMMFSTVRLVAANGMTGTGFFFTFLFKSGEETRNIPIIITNKHVVNDKEKETVQFTLHTREGDHPDGVLNVTFHADWIFHPLMDLCFCYVNPLFEQIKSTSGKDIYYIPIVEDLMSDDGGLEELNVIEEVIMVGYPNGLWDQLNNCPLFRRGITSSHPALDFNEKSIGAVDMACYPGSSGSPIFVLNEYGFADKQGLFHVGAQRFIFLGVLFSGPQVPTKGDLIVEDILMQKVVSSQTLVMMHLGYYIKAKEILSFKPVIEKFMAI